MIHVEIARRIRNLRKERNFSRQYVANHLQINLIDYSKLEKSDIVITIEQLLLLCQLYGVTTDFLLRGDSSLFRIAPSSGTNSVALPLEVKTNVYPKIRILNKEVLTSEIKKDKSFYIEITKDYNINTILKGDVLICERTTSATKLKTGTTVVFFLENEIIIRILLENNSDDGYLVVESGNCNERTEKIEISSLSGIFTVKGKINRQVFRNDYKKLISVEEDLASLKDILDDIKQMVNKKKKF
ncbi:helix-turn-helix domain-containing protein [Autumnicola musiva]|uniref:Helix-turn-helix transcriptional regulator n=1 Tax=Autumnicola musiva TaxID=3075589 RepID=A0ABU3D972_9FLAO|nr:helix-turn-helix transcriptional regulator [Zunongwangia sp. F117]MDT0678082.1 helix-turn-helix transcriptional regulator [Zunongwangia sp. F117]